MRIFTDGAEFGDLLFWDTSPSMSAATDQKRSGDYSYKNGTGSKNVSAVSEFYFRIAGRWASFNSNQWLQFRKGSTVIGGLRTNTSTRRIEALTSTGTLVATGTVSLSLDTWYLIEVHYKIADASGDFEVKIDGITPFDIDFSGDTKPGADTTIDNIFVQGAGGNTWYDDLAFNDTSGSSDNSWCEDGHVVLLMPDSDGDVTTWSGSDGDMINNYLLVDEIPSDSDTTYVESITISGYDLYNLEASALTGTSIRRIWVESRTKNTVAAGGQVAHVIKTNGTEYVGSGINLLTSYTRCVGEEYTQNPNTAAAWTVANLDALQVGPLVKSTG